jgi:hypothetical protein
MGTPIDPIVERFSEFIHLRQTGVSRDEAWLAVLKKCGDLKEKHVQQLLLMAKDWEMREGYKYRHRDNSDSRSTLVQPPEGLRQPTASNGTPKGTSYLDPKTLEQIEAQAQQQKSSAIKPLQEIEAEVPQTNQLRPTSQSTDRSYFGPKSKIIMYFKDFPDEVLTIEVPPTQELIIGRVAANSIMAPDIDLTPVRASYYGISRLHAAIQRREFTVLLSDLGSANHTYLNGERLLPHEWRVLKHDDQITFANMLTQIRFKHN